MGGHNHINRFFEAKGIMNTLVLPWRLLSVGAFITLYFVYLVYGFFYGIFDAHTENPVFWVLIIGIPLGITAAAYALLKTFLGNWFAISVKANYALVVANPLRRIVTLNGLIGPAYRVIPGPAKAAEKWPWEYVVENGAINLETEVVKGNHEQGAPPFKVLSKYGVGYLLKFQAPMRGYSQYLGNLIQRGETATQLHYIARIMQWLFHKIATSTEEEIYDLLDPDSPRNAGGEIHGIFTQEEMAEYGMLVRVEILSIEKDQRVIDATEGSVIADSFSHIMQQLIAAGCPPTMATLLAGQMAGMSNGVLPLLSLGGTDTNMNKFVQIAQAAQANHAAQAAQATQPAGVI